MLRFSDTAQRESIRARVDLPSSVMRVLYPTTQAKAFVWHGLYYIDL